MSTQLQPQMQPTLPEIYEQYVTAGKLQDDAEQRAIVDKLESTRIQLMSPSPAASRGLFGKLFADKTSRPAPRSLYIWGDVGRGKSMLMDMFYLYTNVKHKRRIHFHAFMTEIHASAHRFRQTASQENPIVHIARLMAAHHPLLCLDELQVTDVADAMILNKLFQTQLDKGVTFIITSNRPPEELYKGGLQREKFLAFVELVRARMDVMELSSKTDYRMRQLRAMQSVYFFPRNEHADKTLRDTYKNLTQNAERHETVLDVQGRKLPVHESSGSVAMFTFHELCEQPLGAADYMAIAKRFSIVLISGIPRLSAEKRNEARRFVTLIDALYDWRVKLLCTAEVAPDQLYPEGDGTFEFRRTASRLAEMQSESYLASEHLG